jgi:hypothetical protein
LLSLFYERGQVDEELHEEGVVMVNGRLPKRLVPYFAPYLIQPTSEPKA